MEINRFYLDFNVTGAERERLVRAISEYTQADPEPVDEPAGACMVDYFLIDDKGCVSFDDRADSVEIECLIEVLANQGFVSAVSNLGCEDDEDGSLPDGDDSPKAGLTVSMPMSGFDVVSLNNLHDIISAKGRLIRKALGVELLPVRVEEETVSFPWFENMELNADEIRAYTHFISALCGMAKTQKRITARDKETDNDKYAFRCFLLRLGFIGPEYKTERKILLRRLSGSPAFKSGTHSAPAALESEAEA